MAGPAEEAALRAVVHEIVADVLAQVRTESGGTPPSPPSRIVAGTGPASALTAAACPPGGFRNPADASVRQVSITNDEELAEFVAMVVRMCDNPKARMELKSRKVSFSLAAPARDSRPRPSGAVERVRAGVVNERGARAMIAAGLCRLEIGPRVTVTPLARDLLRAKGIEILKGRWD